MAPPAGRGARRTTTRNSARADRENPPEIHETVIEIEPEELSTAQQPINILMAGPAGHGKTSLLAFAKPGHTYIISTESGGPIAAKRAGASAKVFQAPVWGKVAGAVDWCDKHLSYGDWVIMDSLTKMQVLMIRWILEEEKKQKGNRDLDVPAIQDYQKWQGYFKRFVDKLIDAPYNVVLVCNDMIRSDEDGEEIVLPQIEGKDYAICNYVRAQTSLNIYYAVTDKFDEDDLPEDYSGQVRRALFQPSGKFVFPKDRFKLFGMFRDVLDDEYPFADWVAEIEQVLAEGAVPEPEPEAAPVTQLRRKKTAAARRG